MVRLRYGDKFVFPTQNDMKFNFILNGLVMDRDIVIFQRSVYNIEFKDFDTQKSIIIVGDYDKPEQVELISKDQEDYQ